MALRLVRETSDTPNITNKDDTIMTRYAYGGYNGVVKGFGSECEYTANNGIFKVLGGRIIIDGWEVDVDGEGFGLNLSTVYGTQYHSVYLQINIAVESVDIKSSYLTGSYPTIEKGDDLTSAQNGSARLLLYNVKVENGIITEVVKRFEIVPYLTQKVLDIEKNLSDLNLSIKGENKPLYAYDETKGTIEDRLNALGFKWASISVFNSNYIDAANTNIYSLGKILYGLIKFKIPKVYKNDGNINVKIASFDKDKNENAMLLPYDDLKISTSIQYIYGTGAYGNTDCVITINKSGEIWIAFSIPNGASIETSFEYKLLCDNYQRKFI